MVQSTNLCSATLLSVVKNVDFHPRPIGDEGRRLPLIPAYIAIHVLPVFQRILGTSVSFFHTQYGWEQWEFLLRFQAPLHRRRTVWRETPEPIQKSQLSPSSYTNLNWTYSDEIMKSNDAVVLLHKRCVVFGFGTWTKNDTPFGLLRHVVYTLFVYKRRAWLRCH